MAPMSWMARFANMYATHHKPVVSPIWAQPLQIPPPARFRYRTLAVALAVALLCLFWLHGNPPRSFGLPAGYSIGGYGRAGSSNVTEWGTAAGNLIPPKIWQINLNKQTQSTEELVIDQSRLETTASWLALNPGYAYTLVGEKGGLEYVQRHFSHQPDIVAAYTNMPNVGMKSDFLRYLVLGNEGGVYTDTDTVALQPIDRWVPAELRSKVRLIVGIEFDRRDGGGWADILHWVQFCQWTIAAAPGHAVFRKMAARVLRSLDEMSAAHDGVPVSEVRPSSTEVMNSTGPAAWTETVFLHLQELDDTLTDIKNISYLTEPKLVGDVLILPIDGFGMGQPHSQSTNDGSIPPSALMKHLFNGSWRGS